MENKIKEAHPIQGIFVAVPTFYGNSYAVDYQSVERYIDWLCSCKIQGLVICGTTGEGMAQSPEEYRDLIRLAMRVAKGRVHIMAGTFGVIARMVVGQIRCAQEEGAHSALVLSPHYIKPSQEGLFEHYEEIHRATELPIILYNNPNRTGTPIAPETVYRLSKLRRVVGIKDSTSDMTRPMEYSRMIQKKNWANLCGEDSQFWPFLASGGNGIISVSAGINPSLYKKIWDAWQINDWKNARKHATKIMPLNQALGRASNPAPVKYALERLGFGSSRMRYVLGDLTEESKREILSVIPKCLY